MSPVLVDVRDGVATVILNQPNERNALTPALVDAIVSAMDAVDADPAVGAVVLTGAPPAFCAGANLGNLAEADESMLQRIYYGFMRIARSPLPTIAAVNGAAVGAGLNLALVCDVRLAGVRARFDSRFLQIGVHPGGGNTWMMCRLVGPQATFANLLFGDVLDGPEAERVGLVHRCVPDDQLLDVAHEMAARAAAGPRELVIRMKDTIQRVAHIDDHDAALELELHRQLWSTRQPWFAERIAALRAELRTN